VTRAGSLWLLRAEASRRDIPGRADAVDKEDVYSVVGLPDNVTAAAVAKHISAGGLARCEVVALVAPEELDKRARTKMHHRPPEA
jgi:hypothetical protein